MNYYSFLNSRRSGRIALDTDWGAHDRRFHGGNFDPKTMTCSLREDLGRTDGVDDLGNPKTDPKDAAGPKRWVEFLSLIEKRKGGRDVTPSDIEQMYGELQKIGDRREKKASAWWLAHGTIRLPEDASKVRDALDVAAKAKKDPLSYRSPMELILDNREFRPSEKPIDPDTVPELSDRTDMGHGVVTYLVQDDRDGQKAMRKIIDTHWGRDANPWCVLARVEDEDCPYDIDEWWSLLSKDEKEDYGKRIESYIANLPEDVRDDLEAQSVDQYYESEGMIDEDYRDLAERRWWRENVQTPSDEGLGGAWSYWQHYSALPKRVAFKDGRLLSFMATDAGNDGNGPDMDYMGEEIYSYLTENYPDIIEEWDATKEDLGDDIGNENISEWLLFNHGDVYDEVYEAMRDPREEWWDRMDKAHDGIPLGNMVVPDDPHGRWGDFEIVDGEMKMVGGFRKGEDGKSGFVEWHGNGKKKTEITDRMKAKYDADGHPTSVFEFGKNGGTLGSSYFKYDPNHRDDPLKEGLVTIGERTEDGDDLELLFDSGIPTQFRSPKALGEGVYSAVTSDVVPDGRGGYSVEGVEPGSPLDKAFRRLLGRFGEAKDKYASMTQK